MINPRIFSNIRHILKRSSAHNGHELNQLVFNEDLKGLENKGTNVSFHDALFEGFLQTGLEMLNQIEKELSGSPCPLQIRGEKEGEILVDPKQTQEAIKLIREKYEGVGLYLEEIIKEAYERENAQAKKKIKILESELKILENELDESQEGSKAFEIKVKIDKKEEELKAFENTVQERNFLKQYKDALEERNTVILEEISSIQQQVKELDDHASEEMQNLQQAFDALMSRFFSEVKEGVPLEANDEINMPTNAKKKSLWQKFVLWLKGGSKKPQLNTEIPARFKKYSNSLKGIKEVLSEFPLLFQVFAEATYQKNDLLDELKENMLYYLGELRSRIIKDAPLVLPRSQILGFYFITFVIFGGEVYLIYAFLSETLGFDFKDDTSLHFTTFFGYVFCVAIPLALGLFFKERLEDDKPELNFWFRLIVFALLAVGLVNAISIHQVQQLNAEEQGLIGETDYLPQILADESIFHLVSIIGIWIFLPILSLFFARVGAWTFKSGREAHLHYAHITQQSLLRFRIWSLARKRWDQQKKLEKEIDSLKEELRILSQDKERKQTELINAQALSDEQSNMMKMKPIFDIWTEGAIAAYKAGFTIGKGRVEQKSDEEQLIRLKNKQRVFDAN